ncbi:MAG: Nif3-like dinuclear metal center hexameric protein [Saprospiraceae bacterium]|nr:Nif3-like dinuclear metal center hexameric protein [Saprospiraceae bacterium]
MQISDIIAYLESVAPLSLQEHYDNAGLLVGHARTEVTGALVCMDSTPEVVAEAKTQGCNLIIAHHPIIFRGLKRLNGSDYVQRAVMAAIKEDIAIYAIHTNLDNVLRRGVNGRIAKRLGLQDMRVLSARESDEVDDETGAGVVGRLQQPLDESAFLAHLKTSMALQVIRHTPLLGRQVRTVAVCGGAGSFLLQDAIRAGADVYVSADFKYHELFDADGKIVITDIGHFESERFTVDLIIDLLREKFPKFAARSTEVNTNPVTYYH